MSERVSLKVKTRVADDAVVLVESPRHFHHHIYDDKLVKLSSREFFCRKDPDGVGFTHQKIDDKVNQYKK